MNPDRSLIDIPVHPVADLFPLMSETEFTALVDDIERPGGGLITPIVMRKGVLIDGRNRYLACKAAGVEPRFVEYDERFGFVTWFIISCNARRRNLSNDRIVAICHSASPYYREEKEAKQKETRFKEGNEQASLGGKAKAGKLPVPQKSGEPAKRDSKKEHANSTAGALAEAAGTSRYKAEQVLEVAKAAPELVEKVASGIVSLKDAVKAAKKLAPPKPKPAATNSVSDLQDRFERAWKRFCDGFTDEELSEVKTILRKRLL